MKESSSHSFLPLETTMVNVVAKSREYGGVLGWLKTRTRTAWLLLVMFLLVCVVRFIRNDDEDDKAYSSSMFGLEGRPANQRVAYIMYGQEQHQQFSPSQFKERVVESLKTWLAAYRILYYVFDMKFQGEFEAVCQSNKELAAICQQVIPIHINCPTEESPDSSNGDCCRHDQGMAAMYRDYPSYDWYVYLDDDIYIRTAFMEDYLSGFSPVKRLVLTDQSPQPLLGVVDSKANNCSIDSDFLYPKGETAIVYSNAALRTIAPGFEMNAVSTQCSAMMASNNHDAATSSPSYQTASALVHWMYSLPHVRLPLISGAVQQDFHGATFKMIGLHGAGNQKLSGSDALEIHKHVRYRRHPKPPYEYEWHRPNGFLQTSAHSKYGDVTEWTEFHALSPLECLATAATASGNNNQT
jgi:Fringe-like